MSQATGEATVSGEKGYIRIDARFDKVEKRLDKVEARLGRVETRLEGIDRKLDRLIAEKARPKKASPRRRTRR